MQKQNIRQKITYGLILALIIIIILQRCSPTHNPISTSTRVDTIWKTKHDTVVNNVILTQTIPDKAPNIPQYQPSNDIDTCKTRFNKLLKDYITRRVYKDTLKLDSLGTITIIDTVQFNKLSKRIKIYDYKIPIITKTVTITKQEEAKRQLYIGANLFGDKTQLQLITPGILYKTKKDHIYQINIGVNFDGSITYGVGMYYKIKLK